LSGVQPCLLSALSHLIDSPPRVRQNGKMKNTAENVRASSAPQTPEVATQSAAPSQAKKKSRPTFKSVVFKIILLLLIIAAVFAAFMYYKTRQELRSLTTPQGQQEAAKKEIKTLVASLGKLTILPDEDPVIATILDEHALATQSAFYKDAQKGDKLLVYPKAQKAYIYSPSRNLLVNSGPLILDQNKDSAKTSTESPTETPAAQAQFTIEVRNGTTVTGVGTKMKQKLVANGYDVAAVNDASLKDYTSTQVFAVSAKASSAELKQLEQQTGGKLVTQLRDGEATSTADVLVIVGGQ
jgi:hypothetical protein